MNQFVHNRKTLQKIAAGFLTSFILFAGFLYAVQPALGATGDTPPGDTGNTPPGNTSDIIPNPLGTKTTTLCQLVNILINVITEIGAIVAVLFILWSGFLFVKAQGNPKEIEDAKRTFYTTLIGTAILLGASVIARVIFTTINAILPHNAGNIVC